MKAKSEVDLASFFFLKNLDSINLKLINELTYRNKIEVNEQTGCSKQIVQVKVQQTRFL